VSENSKKLTGLQPGTVPTPSPGVQQPASSSNQDALGRLQAPQGPPPGPLTRASSPSGSTATGSPRAPKPSRGRTALVGVGVGVAMTVAIVVAVGGVLLARDPGRSEPLPSPSAVDTGAAPVIGLGEPDDLPGLIAQVTPSTFMIECPEGQGSGFVLDTKGLTSEPGQVLVTNQHVIQGCEGPAGLMVTTNRGQYPGTVISSDRELDLAIIDVPGLQARPLSVAGMPVTGQWVMAVGSPLGYRDSAAPGIVTNVASGEQLITTNVALGPGNSGGPLVDNQGRVVGINFAVWEEADSIGLARQVGALCALLDCR